MLSCKQLTELSTQAREGSLRGLAHWRYRFHLTVCPGCQAYVHGLETTLEVLRDSPPSTAPAEVKHAAVALLRQRKP